MPPKIDFSKIPGQVKLTIIPFQDGDLRFREVWPDGRVTQNGYRLADLLKKAINGELEMTNPITREKSTIPMKAFEQFDPETTFLSFNYVFEPDHDFMEKHPDVIERINKEIEEEAIGRPDKPDKPALHLRLE